MGLNGEARGYHLLEDLLNHPELMHPPPAKIPRLAWSGRLTAIGSEPKCGKSTLVGQAIAAYVSGEPFLDEPLCAGTAVWLALDEPLGDAVRRLAGFGATRGVALMAHRPGITELESAVRDLEAGVVVIDTLTELAAGVVEDGNAAMQWQPILKDLRSLLQRTDSAGIVLHHTGKSSGRLLGSTQIEAGVDCILTMKRAEDSPGIRHLKASGRIPTSDFSLSWDGERSTLHTGELSLETRVFHAIAATPGVSRNRLRELVVGKGKAIDTAADGLCRRGLVDNRAPHGGYAYHVRSLARSEGPGRPGTNGDDPGTTPPLSFLTDVGRSGTTLGRGGDDPASSPTLKSGGGTRSRNEDELERLAIEEESVS